MATRQTVIAIALTLTMVGAAGCAGWGVDGPADDGDEPDGGDELEDADGEAQADQGDDDGATDDDGHDDATDTGSDSADTGTDESGPDPHDSGIDDGTDPDDTDADANGDAGTGVDDGTGTDDDAATDTGPDADSDPDVDDGADGVDDGNGDDGTDAGDDDGSDTDSETHTLHVGIVDETAAGPVAGTVTVDGQTKEVSADDGATFELEDGTYTVTGETKHDPESWHVEEREVTIDGEDEEVTLSANPIRTLTVETNDAAHDVTLERHSDGATTTKTTDDDGSVEYSVVPGNYSIHADGYESADVTVPGDRYPDTVTLEPIDDGEPATHTLRVTIVDVTAAGEVEGTVTVDGETKEATPDDPAEFELEEGTYTVSGQHDDDWYVHDETVEIDGEDVDLTLHTVPIRELTVDAGEPGVEVTVERENYGGETITGTTGDDGTVTFETIPGDHTISAEGYETEEVTVPGDFEPESVVLEPVDDGRDTRTLTVRVVDPNDEPVVGETVHVVTYSGGADVANGETDEDGEVRFEVEDGDYEIAVSAPDKGLSQPSDDRLVTVDGEDTTRTIQLVSTGVEETERTLTVNVVDQDGEPIEGASIHATGPVLSNGVAHEPAGETNADGVATLTAYDGEYGLEVQHGDEIVQQDVTVDGDTETTVELPPDEPTDGEENTATGIVRVVDDDGEPIAGERVTLTPPATVQESAKEQRVTNDDGEVVIELAAGEPEDVVSYGVEVRGEEKSLAIMSDEHAGVQEVEVNPTDRMYLFETVIQVVDENGDPVEGVEVEARNNLYPPDDDWKVVGETDEHGEVVLTGGSSIPSDVTLKDVRVRDRTITTSVEYERKVETIEIETDENENGTALARTGGPIVTPTPS